MLGTVFLFLYWPSFNAALATGMASHRAAVNTLFSISASVLSSCYVSRLYCGKIDMEVMLNSSLAGGVVMGAACDIIVGPGFCMIAGAIAGAISAIGFLKFNPMSKERLAIHDTCGVHFLHGIPGFLGAIVCIIAIAAGHYNFEHVAQLDIIFPANKTDRTVQQQAQI